MAYFDLHIHPILKPQLSAVQPNNRNTVWREVDIPLRTLPLAAVKSSLDSQASLAQLWDGQVSLSVSVHYSLEQGIAASKILQRSAERIPEWLSKELLTEIAHVGKPGARSYFDHLRESLALLPQELHGPKQQLVRVINSVADYQPNAINLIRCIEGAHSLCGDETGSDAANNLKVLLDEGYRFLYLTLAHLEQNPFCSHAFGMKMKALLGVIPITKDQDFYPSGQGITPLGLDLIEAALDAGPGRRVLIDVKHMSRSSRVQYYDIVNARRDAGKPVPIIWSHGAATGCSWTNPPFRRALKRADGRITVSYLQRNDGLRNTDFNPWSINLYDEDIRAIVASRGLIGLSLDKRICGVGHANREVLSVEEFQSFPQRPKVQSLRNHLASEGEPEDEEEVLAAPEPEDEQELDGTLSTQIDSQLRQGLRWRKHLRHLANQILHMVRIGGSDTWTCLCIGSDLDGIINPLVCSRSALDLDEVEEGLLRWLPKLADETPTVDYGLNDVRSKVRGIMWRNAWDFLEREFNSATQ
ncbi:hypothetical protein [Hymenobacter tenuis]